MQSNNPEKQVSAFAKFRRSNAAKCQLLIAQNFHDFFDGVPIARGSGYTE